MRIPTTVRLMALLMPAVLLAESRFIDEDTLEIIATGKARKTGKPAFEKAACTDAARQMGSVEAIEVLVDKGWENVKGTVTKTGFADQMTRIVSGKVRGVKVMNVEMLEDPKVVKCRVTLEYSKLDVTASSREAAARAAGQK